MYWFCYPDGTSLMQLTNTISFDAASTATDINDSGIQVTVNGANVSGNLTITGTSRNKHVTYSGITSNRVYTVTMQVADAGGLIASRTVSFDTFSPAYYTWEAEDYDYTNGLYFNSPQTNSYSGLVGTLDVDYHAALNDKIQRQYRPDDLVGTEGTTDAQRPQYAGTNDFNVFEGGWNLVDHGKLVIYGAIDPRKYSVAGKSPAEPLATRSLRPTTRRRPTGSVSKPTPRRRPASACSPARITRRGGSSCSTGTRSRQSRTWSRHGN